MGTQKKFGEWDVIERKVVDSTLAKGYRTGTTRYYRLECGHVYNEPASRMQGREKRECIFCMALWRYLIGERGLINVEFALKTIEPDMLREMHILAEQGKKQSGAAPTPEP